MRRRLVRPASSTDARAVGGQNSGGMAATIPPSVSDRTFWAVADHWITDSPRAPAVLYFVVTALPKAVLTTDDPEQVPVPKTPVVA